MHCDVDEGGSAWLKYMPPNFVMSLERVGTILEPILAHPQMQDLRRTRNERQRTSLRKMDVRFPRRVMTMNQAGLRFLWWVGLHWAWMMVINGHYMIYMLSLCWLKLVLLQLKTAMLPYVTQRCITGSTAARRFRWRDGLLQMLQVHRSGIIYLWDSQDETTAESVETQQAHVTLEVVVVCKPLQAAP